MNHRYMDPGLPCFRQFLVVFAEPPAPAQPGQCAFHHPPAGQDLELVAVRVPAHHLQQPSASGPSPRHQAAGIRGISPDDLEPGKPAQQSAQHQSGPVPPELAEGPGCWRHERPRPRAARWCPPRCGASVIAARPPFSVVLTDWLSMIAPLGVASRPSLSRTIGRSASSTRSQVPSLRHFRKYHQTVPQGGRS